MSKLYKGSNDEFYAKVNASYKSANDDREAVKETGIDFDVVQEMLGFKDWYVFYETAEGQMEGLSGTLILGICIWILIRFHHRQLKC